MAVRRQSAKPDQQQVAAVADAAAVNLFKRPHDGLGPQHYVWTWRFKNSVSAPILRYLRTVIGIQRLVEPLDSGWIGFLLDHGFQDGLQESAVYLQCFAVVRDQRSLDCLFCRRCNEFEPSDKCAHSLCRSRVDREW